LSIARGGAQRLHPVLLVLEKIFHISPPGNTTSEESIALKRAEDLEKERMASDRAQKEEAKNAKRRKAVVEVVTHAITILETIAACGLGTVDSLKVKDLKAMLQHYVLEAPEAKGNNADLRDRVMVLASVN
jgi:hypothetical protein